MPGLLGNWVGAGYALPVKQVESMRNNLFWWFLIAIFLIAKSGYALHSGDMQHVWNIPTLPLWNYAWKVCVLPYWGYVLCFIAGIAIFVFLLSYWNRHR